MGADVFDLRKARSVLRDAARRHLRQNAYIRLREHDRKMPPWAFASVITVLASMRFLAIGTLFVAWRGWLTDPRFWSTGAKIAAEHVTPFHHTPNLFGWRFGFQGLVAMHNVTGILLFLVCLVPLFSAKGESIHIRFGRAFVVFWLLHLFDGLVNSGQILLVRGFEPTHYFDAIKQGFSLYLYIQFAFISSVVIDFLAHGLAALQYKNHVPGRAMRALMITLPSTSLVLGVGMMLWGVRRLFSDEPPATPNTMEFAVIFVAQVPAYLYLLGKNIAYWMRPSARAWLQGWVTEHQRNLMFCVQVTLYTGFANVTMKFAPKLTAPLFISIDVGFIVWLLLKERAIRRNVAGARMGFALVSMLRRGQKPVAPAPLSPADEHWIMKTFDLDGDGSLDASEVRALLAAHGIELSEAELAKIKGELDHDGSGVIDRHELAVFLSGFLGADPSYDDDLALAFRALDADGDGKIDTDELRRALGGPDAGALTLAEVDAMLERVEVNRGGSVKYETFAGAVESKRRGWHNPWAATEAGEAQARASAEAPPPAQGGEPG